MTQGEIKFRKEDLDQSKIEHDDANYTLQNIEKYLDATKYNEWKQVIPYLITFHLKFKEDVFGVDEFNPFTKYNLVLVRQENSTLTYKDMIDNTIYSKSKYSYLKHLNKTSTLHFYHQM